MTTFRRHRLRKCSTRLSDDSVRCDESDSTESLLSNPFAGSVTPVGAHAPFFLLRSMTHAYHQS